MADLEEENQEEFELARKLKDDYCDESGKEKKTCAAKAGEIIYKIGLIYRKRSPDQISLIKSAGLFNAAILRNPSNVSQIKFDLSELCQHVLQQAKAEKQNADLVKKAEQVKLLVNELRNYVNRYLQEFVTNIPLNTPEENSQRLMLNKITAIKQLNKNIADEYRQIMSSICQFCEDVMGEPPCSYTIVGMGSLAREEITPYSDFEHIILLFDDKEYKFFLPYFRWFSIIFHIIILNVQETVIPSLNINSFNDTDTQESWFYDNLTPQGISFDGMMPHACKFPLGRQQHTKKKQFTTELIKPVSEMLEYLSSEADLKNGYHLADILTKSCFVFGNKNIFKQFVKGVQNYQENKLQTDVITDVQQQVKDDLKKFSTRFQLTKLNSQNTINVKRFVYRSCTLFIAALAKIYKVSANSCFDMINEMEKQCKIEANVANKLRYAVAIACEIRLRVYMNQKSQRNLDVDLNLDGIKKFLDIVGVASTVNYFQIVYCLQCEVAKQLNLTKLHFFANPNLINITIGLAFNISYMLVFSETPQKRFWNSSEFNFSQCIKSLETDIKFNLSRRNSSSYSSYQTTRNTECIKNIADYLKSVKLFDEALDFYEKLLNFYLHEPRDRNFKNIIAFTKDQIGFCLIKLKNPKKALIILEEALEIKQQTTVNFKRDKRIAVTLHLIGDCHNDLQNHHKAVENLEQALKIKQNVSRCAEEDRSIASTLHTIGYSHIQLLKYNKALTFLHRALKIKKKSSYNKTTDKSIASTLHLIADCHIDLQNYDEALEQVNRALKIEQVTTLNAEKDKSIAIKFETLARCHISLRNFEKAIDYLKMALKIRENVTLDDHKDKMMAKTFHNIGYCHIELYNYNDALFCLNKALKIKTNITLKLEIDRDLAVTQSLVGRCLTEMQKYNDSWKHLEESLSILQSTTLDEKKDVHIANTCSDIGAHLLKKHEFADALKYLQRALKIHQAVNTRAEMNLELARIQHNICLCMNKDGIARVCKCSELSKTNS